MILADPPAAHSMDTEWFAVDADGHVACFDTGEDGSVPAEGPAAGTGEPSTTGYELVDHAFTRGWLAADADLVALARGSCEVAEPHAFLAAAEAGYANSVARWKTAPWWRRWFGGSDRPILPYPGAYEGLIALDAGDRWSAGVAQRLGDVQIVWVHRIMLDELRALHRDGRCRGCASTDTLRDDSSELMPRLGLYVYTPEIDYSGAILSPYRRREPVPAQPRRLSEFDPAFAQALDPFVFADAHFARDELVQPARTAQCMSYVDPAPAYLDIDLRTVRPQRGMSSLYQAMRGQLAEQASDAWIFEEP